jgi:hypothetical protein
VRSLQDRIAFIINIYQHNKFIESVISISTREKNAKYIRVIEILLALILVDGRVSITSKERTFVVLQLVTNVALIEYTNIFFVYKLPKSSVRKGIQYYSLC